MSPAPTPPRTVNPHPDALPSSAALLDAALINVRRFTGAAAPTRRTLHARGSAGRAGEPDRAELLSLVAGASLRWPGSALDAALGGRMVEWLVLGGALRIDGEALATGDFMRLPLAADGLLVEADTDTRAYVRMGPPVRGDASGRVVARTAEAAWEGDPATLQRRVLWADHTEAALLIRAAGGVEIPPHRHRVDEECLVIYGDVVTGDVLVRAGDFQLAPAGCVHRTVRAATDVLVYLRGDTEYEFVADAARESGGDA